MLRKKVYKELVRGNLAINCSTADQQKLLIDYLREKGFEYKRGFNMEFQVTRSNDYFLANPEENDPDGQRVKIHMLCYVKEEYDIVVIPFLDCIKKEKLPNRFVPINVLGDCITNKDNTMFIQFVNPVEVNYESNKYFSGYSNVIQIVMHEGKDSTWDNYETMVTQFNIAHKTMSTDSTGRGVRLNKGDLHFTKEQLDLINFFTDTLDQFHIA